ncbi:prepilin peptidase [Solibacillus sp. MA9]|uniref:Prepilin peptidase n=2 Tax=Solibacillus palustris TaxID=2908203 RepID=A0ABS9U8M4_9BACL|nr:A24 family peptidase [Solibacillus sp. MA9]MCH7320288.1 prepilin peptidase [Solibacillus sp. MA9]
MLMVFFMGLVGVILGSFFNVVGLRIPKNKSIIAPPSHCPGCAHMLSSIDLIPVLSYGLLRGKCRVCGVRISPIYPLVEAVTALLFAFATWHIGWAWELVVTLLFISLLMIITVSDIIYMLIPDKVLLFFLPFLIVGRILSPLTPWWDSVLGAAFGFLILWFIAIISQGGMGGGDIKLFLLIGLVLGTVNTLLTLFFAALIGLVFGGTILMIHKQGRETPIPFGPAIVIAAIVVYFYGIEIMTAYWHLFE